jgi:hypothetical protein
MLNTKLAEAKEYRESMAMLNLLLENSEIAKAQLEPTFPISLIN